MTRHGKDPNRVEVFRGCGMPVFDQDQQPVRDSNGRLVPCDRTNWHRGTCSTAAIRRAARETGADRG